ncbi:MAG TPA: ATP-binding cassette domain-containing protein, partial [Polyangiaceae bacterium]|nr:ATP-binding cassette domain-containing protein [Polyangiaceae bacterium]
LFVSHRTADLDRVVDHITVLRDGRVAMSKPWRGVSHDELVRALLGGELPSSAEREASVGVEDWFVAKDARLARHPDKSISLRVARGEIVGLAGLQGSGASELLAAAAGAVAPLGGSFAIAGKPYACGTPREALAAGIGFVPADRQRAAVIPDLAVLANATLTRLAQTAARLLSQRAEREAYAPLVQPLRLGRVDADAPLRSLSGGSQQKVCLARALLTKPKVLLCDEPTRGVDVGAKADIHRLLAEVAASGTSVVFFSTDAEELFALADRVVVFYGGRPVGSFDRAGASREAVLRATISGEIPS